MHKNIHRAALAAPLLATLLALGACSDRGDPNEMVQREQPSVEINRLGMKGASDLDGADSQRRATAIMGGVGNGAPEGGVSLDARIATEVKQALQRDAALAGMSIDVSSQDGLVTLHGRAADAAARDRADQVTRGIKDVKSVENQLTVG